MQSKNCSNKNCKQKNPQPFSNFGNDKSRKDGKDYWCKLCKKNDYKRKQNHTNYNNKKENKERSKNNRLLKNYGINLDLYNQKLLQQNHKCKICQKNKITTKVLCVDHDHKNGKIRGLLCRKCKLLIGNCSEDIEVLKRAIEYLIYYNSFT